MKRKIHESQILETFRDVRDFSFEEKKEAAFEERTIDSVLDKILEFKEDLNTKTDRIEEIVERIEKITWFNDLDEESLILINDLISIIRNLHSSLMMQYKSFLFFIEKGIAREEIENFKLAAEDLKNTANDLDSQFFFLPGIPEFTEITKELSALK